MSRAIKTTTRGKTRYALHRTQDDYLEVRVTGRHGYVAGMASCVEAFEEAVDGAEEEMQFMMAQAEEEFEVRS